jgi:hypothetical protein
VGSGPPDRACVVHNVTVSCLQSSTPFLVEKGAKQTQSLSRLLPYLVDVSRPLSRVKGYPKVQCCIGSPKSWGGLGLWRRLVVFSLSHTWRPVINMLKRSSGERMEKEGQAEIGTWLRPPGTVGFGITSHLWWWVPRLSSKRRVHSSDAADCPRRFYWFLSPRKLQIIYNFICCFCPCKLVCYVCEEHRYWRWNTAYERSAYLSKWSWVKCSKGELIFL